MAAFDRPRLAVDIQDDFPMKAESLSIEGKSSSGVSRVIKGLGATAFGQVVAALSTFLLVPFFLSAWGSSFYGRWLTLVAICSYIMLIDFGGQNYIANILTDAYARGKVDEFRERLSQGVSLYVGIAIIASVLLILFLSLPQARLPGETRSLSTPERQILLLLGLTNIISVPGGVYATVYRATGRLARGNFIGNVLRLIIFITLLILLVLKATPLIYAIGAFVLGLFLTVFVILDLWVHIPISRNVKINLSGAVKAFPYLGISIFFWLISLAAMINYQGVILVIGAALPAAAVALFSTHRTATGLVNYVSALLQSPLLPEFTLLYSQDRMRELIHLSILSVKVMVLLTGIFAILLWIFLPIIYPVWTNNQLPLQMSLFAIMLFQGVLAAGWMTTGWPILASNQHKFLAYAALGNAVLTILLSLFAVQKYGVIGVAMATLIGDIVFGLFLFPIVSANRLKIQSRSYFYAILSPVIFLLVLALILLFFRVAFSYPYNLILGLCIFTILIFPTIYFAIGKRDLYWLVNNFRNVIRSEPVMDH